MTDTAIPEITYPPELPVSAMRDEIADAIRDNQVVIVAGATGSGKTTQIPKICLELGRTSIGHTQPRRLAARTIAERIAEELGQEVGGLVGYQVRFTDKATASTRVKLMTDGILLNEMHRDRLLRRYDTIIIDEAHERSLNIDFLLGYLKELLPKRPDLKVIVTSATIDPESFAKHFADADGTPAKIIEVSGRTYPVEIRYRPLVAEESLDEDDEEQTGAANPADDKDYLQGILEALDELNRESSGDVLVFLSGENEIRDAEEAVRGHYGASAGGRAGVTEVLPLYGRLSAADQHRVFQPSTVAGVRRRVVLATNVAETSLTVPGIKYVIDAGTARISRYSVRSKVQRLPIEAISQASANQRSGRSGRTSNGIAIRLYSEEDFNRRPEFTEPEVLRTNLAAVILQMIALDLGDIAKFPFLTPPDSRGVKDGLDLLTELGAIRAGKTAAASAAPRLTRIGQQLAKLPIDPRFGRMVIESKTQNVSRDVLAIVAGLTIQDPRERPLERRQQADEKHARFADPTSDFLSLLNLWNYLEKQQRELGSSAFRRLCKAEHLNYLRVREWNDVYRQLRQLAKPLGLTVHETSRDGEASAPNPDGIHRALLSGLLSHIGLKDQAQAAKASGPRGSKEAAGARRGKGEYIGARQARFTLFPGSALAKKQPDAVMSAELVETSRLFARTNAAIDPAWAEPLAGDLCKRSYSEPHWSKSQGSVIAYEKVTLYGVPIVPKRRVQFGNIDPHYARELFIRHALVEGEWDVSRLNAGLTAFDRANKRLRAELEQLEERTRRRDILVDDEAVFEFYNRRIPPEVASTRSFETWWRTAHKETPELLTMTAEALVPEDVSSEADSTLFPPSWRQDDQVFTLRYKFEPGAVDDGVSVVVPLTLLARLRPEGFDWQVDGLRGELITALLKSLPKVIRRNVVPAADWAAKIAAELPERPEGGAAGSRSTAPVTVTPFTEAIAAVIKKLVHIPVTGADFDLDRVPPHLRVTFRVVDGKGREIDSDKDLRALQGRLSERARDAVASSFADPDAGGRGRRGGRPGSDDPQTGDFSVQPRGGRPGRPGGPGAPAASAFVERSGLTTFPTGLPSIPGNGPDQQGTEIPRFVDLQQGGNTIRAYPALVDEGQSVALRLLTTAEEQARAMPGGIRRLLLLAVPSPSSYVQKHLTGNEKLTLAASPYRTTQALFDDCLAACVDDVLFRVKPDGLVFSKAEFETVRDRVSSVVMDTMFETVKMVTSALTAARKADKALKAASSITIMSALADARQQLDGLVYPGFVSQTGLERLRHLPRYLGGISVRVEKLVANPGRDRVGLTEIEAAQTAFRNAGGTIPLAPHAPANLVKARWMLEELRISLFAQELRTAESVSLQRINKVLAG
ncbi:ATP-dependent RNA helicase HrpA [Microterricola viridarii]|uniref:ATP-dependent helicase HrpA n=2 Tax=Microterricola TaxID=518733 RepID=A0A1H1ZPE4_9MICO|nr:ATP-dependent RNA helicase HrpA [Microterricola viridarii]SDT35588.1 ATP-dependent helicase HrpA [Microterricola viridarii]